MVTLGPQELNRRAFSSKQGASPPSLYGSASSLSGLLQIKQDFSVLFSREILALFFPLMEINDSS